MPSNFYRLSHLHHPAALLSHPSSPSLTQTSALLFSFAILFPTRCSRDSSKMKGALCHLSSYRALTAAQYHPDKTSTYRAAPTMLLGAWFTLAAALPHRPQHSPANLNRCGSSCSHARTKLTCFCLCRAVCLGYNWETPTHLTSLRSEITLSLKPFLTAILLQYNSSFPPLHFCLH